MQAARAANVEKIVYTSSVAAIGVVGNGGWAGSISYGALADALADGYAAASTDTGHIGGNVELRGARTTSWVSVARCCSWQ